MSVVCVSYQSIVKSCVSLFHSCFIGRWTVWLIRTRCVNCLGHCLPLGNMLCMYAYTIQTPTWSSSRMRAIARGKCRFRVMKSPPNVGTEREAHRQRSDSLEPTTLELKALSVAIGWLEEICDVRRENAWVRVLDMAIYATRHLHEKNISKSLKHHE